MIEGGETSGDNEFTFDFSYLLPDVPWFWNSLQRCDVNCCGLDEAFAFTHKDVRWACGDNLKMRGRKKHRPWRDDDPGDALQLARHLRETASELRASDATYAVGGPLIEERTPTSYADLLTQLAEWLDQPGAYPAG